MLPVSALVLAAGASLQPFPGCRGGTLEGCPSVLNTTLTWFDQPIDHFDWSAPLGDAAKTTFSQRVFMHTAWWRPGAPILFYFGNEDNVELYVNHTGFMWEAARPLNAALVFAEHRYYGETRPYEDGTRGCLSFLTTEQAMADFARLIYHLRDSWAAWDSPVLGFGGSYGGMIAAWFRLKYPNAVDAVLAASAPIWSFVGLQPAYDYNAFFQIVTRDAPNACAANVKRVLQLVESAGDDVSLRSKLQKTLSLCAPVESAADVWAVKVRLEGAWALLPYVR